MVSVICLSYNHEKFIKRSLESVLFQTYPDYEMIIVDDASQDNSVKTIEKFIQEIPEYAKAGKLNVPQKVKFIPNTENLGNCKSFNKALKLASGKYVIDWATDDIMLDTRLESQVNFFDKLEDKYGVIFTNALLVDEKENPLHTHYPLDKNEQSKVKIPQGDVYKAILEKYFISTPTMMIRKSVLDELSGYDENLSYEDFDFWVRSSRRYRYAYLDEITTLRRVVKGSLSTKFYLKNQNSLLDSTLVVCQKALVLNQNEAENRALAKAVNYHLRQSFYTQNFDLVKSYAELLKKLHKPSKITKLIIVLAKSKIKIFWLYKLYLSFRKRFRKT